MGTDAGNSNQQRQELSDKHRADYPLHGTTATSRKERAPHHGPPNSGMEGPAAGEEARGRRLD